MSLNAECIFNMLLTAEEKALLRRLREIPGSEIDYSETPVLNLGIAKHVIDFEFSQDEQARIHELIARNSADRLLPEEKLELEQFLDVERTLVILKARSIRMIDLFGAGMFERAEGVVAPHEEVLRWHDEQLKNRPDWHSKDEQSGNDLANEQTIRQEGDANGENIEPLTVEDLIAQAIQEGKIIQGINDPETSEDSQAAEGSLDGGAGYAREQIRSLLVRWVVRQYGRSTPS